MKFSHYDVYKFYRLLPRSVRMFLDLGYKYIPERFLRSRSTYHAIGELNKTQWYTPAVMYDYQLRLLKQLLTHAGMHVPYYRELFHEIGFTAPSMKSLCDISAVPILTKKNVQENFERLKSEINNAGEIYPVSTSGSTGNYLQFIRDTHYYDWEQAFTLRYYQWAGVHLHWRHVVFYRDIMHHPTMKEGHPPFEKYRNRLILSQFHTDDESLRYYIDILNKFRPEYITIFPSTLLILTHFCQNSGRAEFRPRVIICYSENLYHEDARAMEKFWGCRVFNRYGHAEGCVSAAECEKGNVHVSSEFGLVEFLREDGTYAEPGESARMIATGFYTFAMPFIRYDTGDLAVLATDQCACGRGLPVLERIDGRADDIIITTDGKKIAALRNIFSHTMGIRSAQIVQEEIGSVIIKIVPDDNFNESIQDVILHNLKNFIGNVLKVQFQIVDDVERSPSGKIRLVLSKVKK